MEQNQNAPEETLAELCRQADAEQDLDKLLEIASKIQRLIDARRSEKYAKSRGAGMADAAQSDRKP
jgi:hypothetical protein